MSLPWLALAAAVGALNFTALRLLPAPFPPAREMQLAREDAARNATLLSLGMRRLAADIAFVRMLLYYGTPEQGGHEGHAHGPDYGSGHYFDLAPQARRILDLDPRFSYTVLYAAGALAFNLDRPQEALALLESGRRTEPKNWRYASTIAAIGFHAKGDASKVLSELEPLLRERDCPTMLKNIAAFLCVRSGRKAEARRLYREILESRDKDYHEVARKALERL
ncbi:MAG: hypothetical protein AAB576_09295 [Elusimicrobiota bacterium]